MMGEAAGGPSRDVVALQQRGVASTPRPPHMLMRGRYPDSLLLRASHLTESSFARRAARDPVRQLEQENAQAHRTVQEVHVVLIRFYRVSLVVLVKPLLPFSFPFSISFSCSHSLC